MEAWELDYTGLNHLVGATIVDVRIDSAKEKLTFVLKGEEVRTYYTDGDCCSQSWIEHVSGIEGARGAEVIAVEQVDVGEIAHPQDRGEREYDCLKAYITKIKLRGRPDFEIEYRNNSNGFYGGSLKETLAKTEGMTPLVEDF